MNKQIKYLGIIAFVLLLISCNKKDQLPSDIDPNQVNFILNQPSISTASFLAKCTNYDILLDTVYFLDPNGSLYTQSFNAMPLNQNEEFTIGGYEAIDGTWIIQFRGSIQSTDLAYDISIPYNMNIETGDEE